jgi:hypothetical protein
VRANAAIGTLTVLVWFGGCDRLGMETLTSGENWPHPTVLAARTAT